MTQRVEILGCPIDPVTRDGALTRINAMLEEPHANHVMTPNAEMLVEATRNESFRRVIRAADLTLPDATALLLGARMTGQKLPERVTGVDTVTKLCADLPSTHGVFLLGAKPGIAERAADTMKKTNPNLRVVGCLSGSPDATEADAIVSAINKAAPHLLFVAFGAPKQDLWIHKHLPKLSPVRVAMGVGGTFDFLAGTQKRAPMIFRKIGLEWLWRLILEPKRIGRIFKAVVVFPILVLRHGRSAPL